MSAEQVFATRMCVGPSVPRTARTGNRFHSPVLMECPRPAQVAWHEQAKEARGDKRWCMCAR
jgi:hypothetical protein